MRTYILKLVADGDRIQLSTVVDPPHTPEEEQGEATAADYLFSVAAQAAMQHIAENRVPDEPEDLSRN